MFRRLVAAGQRHPLDWVLRHGYTQWETYQPNGRFWALQSVEAGALCLLSVFLATAAVWLIRRRPA